MRSPHRDGIIHTPSLTQKKRAARPAFFLPHRLLLRHDSAAPSTRQQAKTAHRPVFWHGLTLLYIKDTAVCADKTVSLKMRAAYARLCRLARPRIRA